MKNIKNIVIVIVAIVFLAIAGYYVYDVYKENDESKTIYSKNNMEQATSYNNFTIYNKENNKVTLESYKDMPVAILFWKTDSAESVEMLKILNSKYDEYKDKIIFLPISMSDGKVESIESVQEFLRVSEIPMEVYYDLDTNAASMYNVKEIPTFVFIKKDNTVLNKMEGVKSEDAILANLQILAGEDK